MIAKQSREGWFQSRNTSGFRFGTTPALRATPPDSGGETHRASEVNMLDFLYIGACVVFLGLMWALTKACDRL